MSSTKELRRRIKSVKNTSQITRAMQMVSATKMRKAQNQALSARPYKHTLFNVLSMVSDKISPDSHPLMMENGSSKVGVLVISTDKGLCGALNTNIIRVLQSEGFLAGKKVEEMFFYTVGKKGRDLIIRTGKELHGDFENTENITFQQATRIRKLLTATFFSNSIGEVYILYPHFISTLRQEPRLLKILPIDSSMFAELKNGDQTNGKVDSEFIFEPTPEKVLDFALNHLIDTEIYQALMETKASEHSARMMAMQNATDNAQELVQDLNLAYNGLRQSAITTELLEITSAASALE